MWTPNRAAIIFTRMIDKPSPVKNSALRELREITGLTLNQFCKQANVPYSVVQMAEAGARRLSKKMARQISVSIGCDPKRLMDGIAVSLSGQPYTEATYKTWISSAVGSVELREAIQLTTRAVELLVSAAANDASGKSYPHRFREVVARLSMSVDEILEKFGLRDLLNIRLAETADQGKWCKTNLGELRKQFQDVPEWKAWDSSGMSADEELSFRKTLYPVWSPLFSYLPCSTRDASASVMRKFNLKLELKAKWIPGRETAIHWTEWQILEKDGSFTRFHSIHDEPIVPYKADVPSDHQLGHP